MAYGTTYDEYKSQKSLYDDYLEKSRIFRFFYKYGRYSLYAVLIFIVLLDIFTNFREPLDISELFPPEFTVSYIINVVCLILVFGGFITALISVFYIYKLKREYSYQDIKRDYIFMYESFSAYNDYLENKTPARKSDAKKCLEKSYKIIDNMSYGNIPVALNPNIEQIKFIKKDLKPIIVSMMESKNTAEQYSARELLTLMVQFLYNKNISFLNLVYESANKYKEKEDYVHQLTSKKDLTIAYIANHQAISQLIFTSILLVVVIFIGKKVGATNPQLLAPCVAVIGSSFPIFNWVKNTVFKFES